MLSPPPIWITGASSGIGAALVHAYVDKGWHVIATARGKEALEAVANSSSKPDHVHVLAADLLDMEALPDLVQSAWDVHGGIDLAILNAGIAQWGTAVSSLQAVDDHVLTLNHRSPVACIKALLPKMQQVAHGRIAVVSSIAGLFGQSHLAAYSASKAALTVYMESLKEEVHMSPIRVHVVSPGVIRTGIMSRGLNAEGELMRNRDPSGRSGILPADAASQIQRLCNSRQFHLIIASPAERLGIFLHHCCPRLFYFLLRRKS
jgi:NAD(P)-dependent dehydrogenase (short-subunit alcohol dehydrogenase family)